MVENIQCQGLTHNALSDRSVKKDLLTLLIPQFHKQKYANKRGIVVSPDLPAAVLISWGVLCNDMSSHNSQKHPGRFVWIP